VLYRTDQALSSSYRYGMPDLRRSITLISADRTTEGVLVVFSDNKTILFRTDFLYRNLNDNGNEDYTDTADMLD
jgi:hypothetical protein